LSVRICAQAMLAAMDEQNRDEFYEGPPLEDEERWHDGALFDDSGRRRGEPAAPLTDVELPDGGVYPPQSAIEHPHATGAGLRPASLSRDPSLSRAVDRAEEGLESEAAGYDRTIEGPSPGPLEPDASEAPADSDENPSGSWGSSG
jgi:hypothetical protein